MQDDEHSVIHSIFDLECEAQNFMEAHTLVDGRSLWTALVGTSRKTNGTGCDGFLLGQVERFVEERIHQLSENELAAIWPETEGGMTSIAEGFAEAHYADMIHDIGIEMTVRIVEAVCEEAKQNGLTD